MKSLTKYGQNLQNLNGASPVHTVFTKLRKIDRRLEALAQGFARVGPGLAAAQKALDRPIRNLTYTYHGTVTGRVSDSTTTIQNFPVQVANALQEQFRREIQDRILRGFLGIEQYARPREDTTATETAMRQMSQSSARAEDVYRQLRDAFRNLQGQVSLPSQILTGGRRAGLEQAGRRLAEEGRRLTQADVTFSLPRREEPGPEFVVPQGGAHRQAFMRILRGRNHGGQPFQFFRAQPGDERTVRVVDTEGGYDLHWINQERPHRAADDAADALRFAFGQGQHSDSPGNGIHTIAFDSLSQLTEEGNDNDN